MSITCEYQLDNINVLTDILGITNTINCQQQYYNGYIYGATSDASGYLDIILIYQL
jgi:hypothetical protein